MLHVCIDGASRGNPGLSGIGITFSKNNFVVSSYNEFIGHKTHIQSEYFALKRALQIALFFDTDLTIYSDSKSLITDRIERFKIRRKEIKVTTREVSNLEEKYQNIIYQHILRKNNFNADYLANKAIDEYLKYKKNNNIKHGGNEDSELHLH